MKLTSLFMGAVASILGLGLCCTACNKAESTTSATSTSTAPQPGVVSGGGQTASVPATGATASAAPVGAIPAKEAICAGCGKPESQCTCGEKEMAGAHGATPKPAPAPASITLASGTNVPVVGVAALNQDPKAHRGLIAIDGTVGELYADKGRFMLVDCVTAAGCDDPGCASCGADMKVPVRIDVAKVNGNWPAKKQRVFVVADVQPTAAGGFTIDVHEIRAGDKALLTVGAAANKA